MKKVISIVVGLLVFFGLLYITGTIRPKVPQNRNEEKTESEEKTEPNEETELEEEASREHEAAICAGGCFAWKEVSAPVSNKASLYAGTDLTWSGIFTEEENARLVEASRLKEEEIYSFLQGPRSWEEGISWSGEWCYFNQRRNYFGNFGCGLCCMANIYDTLSPYEVSPWDMLEYAKATTDYAPSEGTGAIGWEMMNHVLWQCGMNSSLHTKPQNYETFKNQVRYAKSMVVLVCSGDDDTYWEHTGGHYVNIWLYEEESETVFLAEPGSPERNRGRIPLRYVYDALKTISPYQYLMIEGYEEEDNEWKGDGIDEAWNRP